MPLRVYDCSMGCVNCGHKDLYSVSIRLRIIEYLKTLDEEVLSHTENSYGEDTGKIFCKTCLMPCLVVIYYSDEDPALVTAGATSDADQI